MKKVTLVITAVVLLLTILLSACAVQNGEEAVEVQAVVQTQAPTPTPEPTPEPLVLEPGYLQNNVTLIAGSRTTIALKKDGTVISAGLIPNQNVSGMTDISKINYGLFNSVVYGLKADGTAVTSNESFNLDCQDWTDIVYVSEAMCDYVGIKSDGTLAVAGSNMFGYREIYKSYEDIVSISSSYLHMVALKSDGTVLWLGTSEYNLDAVLEWEDIIAIDAGGFCTIGLKSDGTAVATGNLIGANGKLGQAVDVSAWTDLVAVSAGLDHVLGLKSDGTVYEIREPNPVGEDAMMQSNVDTSNGVEYGSAEDWTDIVCISAGNFHSAGLKRDGTVVIAGTTYDGEDAAKDWTDIALPDGIE